MKRNVTIAALSMLLLAGCQGGASTTASGPTPGTAVSSAQMATFCRTQASKQYGPSMQDLSTDDPVARGGVTMVKGQWTTDDNGDDVGSFECRFGPGGVFQGISRVS